MSAPKKVSSGNKGTKTTYCTNFIPIDGVNDSETSLSYNGHNYGRKKVAIYHKKTGRTYDTYYCSFGTRQGELSCGVQIKRWRENGRFHYLISRDLQVWNMERRHVHKKGGKPRRKVRAASNKVRPPDAMNKDFLPILKSQGKIHTVVPSFGPCDGEKSCYVCFTREDVDVIESLKRSPGIFRVVFRSPPPPSPPASTGINPPNPDNILSLQSNASEDFFNTDPKRTFLEKPTTLYPGKPVLRTSEKFGKLEWKELKMKYLLEKNIDDGDDAKYICRFFTPRWDFPCMVDVIIRMGPWSVEKEKGYEYKNIDTDTYNFQNAGLNYFGEDEDEDDDDDGSNNDDKKRNGQLSSTDVLLVGGQVVPDNFPSCGCCGDPDDLVVLDDLSFDENRTDAFGNNIMHFAVAQGRVDFVRYLLEEEGFNPMKKNLVGFDHFDVSKYYSQQEIELLMRKSQEKYGVVLEDENEGIVDREVGDVNHQMKEEEEIELIKVEPTFGSCEGNQEMRIYFSAPKSFIESVPCLRVEFGGNIALIGRDFVPMLDNRNGYYISVLRPPRSSPGVVDLFVSFNSKRIILRNAYTYKIIKERNSRKFIQIPGTMRIREVISKRNINNVCIEVIHSNKRLYRFQQSRQETRNLRNSVEETFRCINSITMKCQVSLKKITNSQGHVVYKYNQKSHQCKGEIIKPLLHNFRQINKDKVTNNVNMKKRKRDHHLHNVNDLSHHHQNEFEKRKKKPSFNREGSSAILSGREKIRPLSMLPNFDLPIVPQSFGSSSNTSFRSNTVMKKKVMKFVEVPNTAIRRIQTERNSCQLEYEGCIYRSHRLKTYLKRKQYFVNTYICIKNGCSKRIHEILGNDNNTPVKYEVNERDHTCNQSPPITQTIDTTPHFEPFQNYLPPPLPPPPIDNKKIVLRNCLEIIEIDPNVVDVRNYGTTEKIVVTVKFQVNNEQACLFLWDNQQQQKSFRNLKIKLRDGVKMNSHILEIEGENIISNRTGSNNIITTIFSIPRVNNLVSGHQIQVEIILSGGMINNNVQEPMFHLRGAKENCFQYIDLPPFLPPSFHSAIHHPVMMSGQDQSLQFPGNPFQKNNGQILGRQPNRSSDRIERRENENVNDNDEYLFGFDM